MKMLKIAASSNGAHDNQTYHGFLPDGWAVIPDDMEIPNFPFGEVEAELLPFGVSDPETGEAPQMMTVTKWTPGEMPAPAPETGHAPTLDDRVTTLETSSAEMAEALDLLLSGVTE